MISTHDAGSRSGSAAAEPAAAAEGLGWLFSLGGGDGGGARSVKNRSNGPGRRAPRRVACAEAMSRSDSSHRNAEAVRLAAAVEGEATAQS